MSSIILLSCMYRVFLFRFHFHSCQIVCLCVFVRIIIVILVYRVQNFISSLHLVHTISNNTHSQRDSPTERTSSSISAIPNSVAISKSHISRVLCVCVYGIFASQYHSGLCGDNNINFSLELGVFLYLARRIYVSHEFGDNID